MRRHEYGTSKAHNLKVAGSNPAPATKTKDPPLWRVFCVLRPVMDLNLCRGPQRELCLTMGDRGDKSYPRN